MLGIPPEEIAIDWNQVVFNMLTIKGIYGREMYETWYKMTVMLAVRARHPPGDHPPLRPRRVRGGVRHRAPAARPARSSWTGGTERCTPPSQDQLDVRARRDPRRRPLQGRARDRLAAAAPTSRVGGGRGAEPLRQQLPRPRRPPGADRGRAGGARPLGLRPGVACASSAARRRSTRSSRRGSRAFLGTEDTILYGSCFDANGGLFETLLGPEDAVISDALNHASIIDGIRLCKAQRHRYANGDMDELEAQLNETRRRAPAADRHRRRVLDGRLPRQARRDLRPRRRATTRW